MKIPIGTTFLFNRGTINTQTEPSLLLSTRYKSNSIIMKLIKFKIRRFKELVTGILLASGTQWSLVRLNVVDYVLDGFQFTNKKYVVSESEIEEGTMEYRVLSVKNRKEDTPAFDCPYLLDEVDSLYSFLKSNETLVAVGLHRQNIIYVGKIKDVGAKSFALDTYSTELQKTGIMNIEFAKVRYVQIHTDYLDSLSLLLG